MVSRAENGQKNKDRSHRLKGVLRDSIVMLEEVGKSVDQVLIVRTLKPAGSVTPLVVRECFLYPPRGTYPCQFLYYTLCV